MSASSGATYTHDAVGNRLTKVVGSTSTSYAWDEVNRMIESGPTTGAKNQYKYRADGMRVKKTLTSGSESVFYDGQMPVETFWDESGTSNDVLTRNLVGARGIEMLEKSDNSGTVVSYPLYDTHGNMIATVTKNSGGTAWNIGDERNYDVWGSVRQGNATGGPKGRYVANLAMCKMMKAA